MAGASTSNAPKPRKRVEAETESENTTSLVRAKNGSAFTKCEQCDKDVAAALIDFHSCSMDAIIKMKMDAQVVELHTEAKKKPAARKKPTSTAPNAKKPKKETSKDGKKRPLTAFFIFMADFRKEYKEANSGSKLVKEVVKHAGEKWKSMSDEEKKVYQDKAAELKAEYDKPSETNCEENENEAEEVSDKELEEEVEKEVQQVSDKDVEEKEVQQVSDEE